MSLIDAIAIASVGYIRRIFTVAFGHVIFAVVLVRSIWTGAAIIIGSAIGLKLHNQSTGERAIVGG